MSNIFVEKQNRVNTKNITHVCIYSWNVSHKKERRQTSDVGRWESVFSCVLRVVTCRGHREAVHELESRQRKHASLACTRVWPASGDGLVEL